MPSSIWINGVLSYLINFRSLYEIREINKIHLPRSLTIFPFLWVVAIDIQNSSTNKRAIV